jgi:hypothetical protein
MTPDDQLLEETTTLTLRLADNKEITVITTTKLL